MCHYARDTVDISRSEGRENFIGNLVVTLWTSSDDDCRNTSQVSNDSPSRCETLVRQFEFSTRPSWRDGQIASRKFVIYQTLFFFIPRFATKWMPLRFTVRIVVLVIFAKQYFVIVLGYMYPQYIQALYSGILSDIDVCSIFRMYISIYVWKIYVYIFYEISSSFLTIP